MQAGEVVKFWRDAGRDAWFKKDAGFDADFRARFLTAHEAAARSELDAWVDMAEGALALMILLDQFPRNCFRDTGHMFATDGKALRLARQALDAGLDAQLDEALRTFLYMPFMHSEDPADQDRCVELMRPIGNDSLRFARLHQDIIQRFGRFPHRNKSLGRTTTPGEQAFLDGGGFAG